MYTSFRSGIMVQVILELSDNCRDAIMLASAEYVFKPNNVDKFSAPSFEFEWVHPSLREKK